MTRLSVFLQLNPMDDFVIINIEYKQVVALKSRETDIWPLETIGFHVHLNDLITCL